MKPRTWREQKGLNQAQMAELLSAAVGKSFDQHKVSRTELGQRPTRDTVRAYHIVTAGAVQPGDFYDLGDAAPQPQQGAAA